MTAEIVIMNKSAVALAADSAATVPVTNTRRKIFNTANKVFSLSKYAPVGIMISGGASVMGVPWEIIIKTFREKLKIEKFDTIDHYCDNFFAELNDFPFESEAEKQHISQIAFSVYSYLRQRLDSWIKNQRNQEINDTFQTEKLGYLQSQIEEASLFFAQQSEDKGILDKNALIEIHDKYCDVLDQVIERFFDEYSLSEESQTKLKLRDIAIHAANINPKNINIPMPSSGIVIAGFGEKEYFPRCRSF